MNIFACGHCTSSTTEVQEADKDLIALAGQWNPSVVVKLSRPAIITKGPITECPDSWIPLIKEIPWGKSRDRLFKSRRVFSPH